MLQTITSNSTGNVVKVAQYLMGYAKIKKATDTCDTTFTNFIIKWQTNHKLTADGIIGKNTWAAILGTLPTCSTSKNKKSVYICAIQLLLGDLTVDGIYGNNTKKAVAAYQSANKLTADGICGKNTWHSLIIGTESTNPSSNQVIDNGKILNNCVHYLQWDSKWKNVKYSTHTTAQTIGNSGCGPTSMAMIMATFIDNKITPVEMCKLAVENGYRTYDSGTAWGFFKFIFKKYNEFEKYIETASVTTLQSALREGALAVCSMNANDNKFWTTSGCENGPFFVNLYLQGVA